MKKYFQQILFLFAILFPALCVSSCKQESIMDYEQQAGVYFTNFTAKFTFTENLDKLDEGYALLNIPVKITGSAAEGVRKFKATVYTAEDLYLATETPADADMYSIGDGYVENGMYDGTLPLTVNYKPAMDAKEYTVYLHIVPSNDFPITNLNGQPIRVSFGNVMTKPENWDSKLRRYFGEYSASWYGQILRWTGLKSLPYWNVMGVDQPNITAEMAERWPMSLNELRVYAFMVRELLADWKNDNGGQDILHGDDEFKGQPVKMGTF